jgi:restriction endonuclease S subunit
MITCSIIKKTQLEGAHRLDAEYYQPEYLDIVKKLKGFQNIYIGQIGKVVYGTTPTGGFFEKKGVSFIRSQNFSLLSIDNDFVFCSDEFHSQNKKSKVVPGDILFAAVGATIGQLAIVQNHIQEANINQNIAAVKIKDERFNPYFVGLFFASRYGQAQIERLVTGNAQFYLNSDQIKSFVVPILRKDFQNEIAEIFQNVQKELDCSNSFCSQAEELLLEELGLKDFKVNEDLTYSVKLSDIKSAHRADAEYFQPKYKRIINHLKTKFSLEKLNHLADKQEQKIKPNPQQLYKYIEISDIKTDIGEVNYNEVIGSELPPNARIPINSGELIVSKVRPTRKAIAIIPDFFINNTICSSAFTVFKSSSPLKEYIFITLRSIVGLLQLEQPTTGTEYPTLNDEDVENVLIPLLPQPTQQQIASLVQQSHEARKKAKELLEEAKRRVETLIEGKEQ